jgi:hypothetical protein
MESAAPLIWGLLFSSIGLGYFMYGRRQAVPLVKYAGLALMVYPYFVPNTYALVGIGLLIMALPKLISL